MLILVSLAENSQTISEDDFESETRFAEIRFKILAKSKTGFGFMSKWNAPSYLMFECYQKAQKIGDNAPDCCKLSNITNSGATVGYISRLHLCLCAS